MRSLFARGRGAKHGAALFPLTVATALRRCHLKPALVPAFFHSRTDAPAHAKTCGGEAPQRPALVRSTGERIKAQAGLYPEAQALRGLERMSGIHLAGAVDILPRGTHLRPLRDQIIVKPLDWAPSKSIAIAGNKRKTLRGTVVAAGPGAYLRHYYYRTLPNGRRERWGVKETTYRVPMSVKVGDVVEFGGLENDGYAFQEVLIGTDKHVICQQADVVGVHV